MSGLWRQRLVWTAATAGMMLVLLAPAIWNRFPLIFPDTGGYLTRPIEGVLQMGRSALYGLFLYAGVPLAFWPNIVLQAALTVWLIVLTARAHGLGGRPWLMLGITAVLSVTTALPWFAGQLMPDILFPASILAIDLLAFRAAQLSRWERAGLAAVIAVAIPCHMAAAGMCAAVLIALALIQRIPGISLPAPRLKLAAAAFAAGIALCPLSNWAITGSFAFTPGGSSFLFARLVEDGIVSRYLDERCPDPSLRICPFKQELGDDADDWLWGPNSGFYKLGGNTGFAEEEKRIILATIALYPMMHLTTAAADVLEQLVSFQTEVSVVDNEPTIAIIADREPQLYPTFLKARQQADRFDITPLNYLHVPVAALGMSALLAALIFRRRLKLAPELAALAAVILLALLANAAICGVFSHAVDRYQSRLVPLATFAVALMIARRYRRDRPI
jgi:hypothetical protein